MQSTVVMRSRVFSAPRAASRASTVKVQATAHPKLVLRYFAMIPGRAETTRQLLTYAGIPYEDATFPREEWPTLKATFKFGQAPVLEVDGKQLAQSGAIERYAARLAGLYPEDPWQAAQVEEVWNFTQEIIDPLRPTFAIQDAAEKAKARRELVVNGPIKAKLEKLASLLDGDWFVGNKLTYADFHVHSFLSQLMCGFLEGVPTDMLDAHPKLKAHHNRVSALPALSKMYEGAEGMRKVYATLP